MLRLLDLLTVKDQAQDYELYNSNNKLVKLKEMELDKIIKVLNTNVIKYKARNDTLIVHIDTLDK